MNYQNFASFDCRPIPDPSLKIPPNQSDPYKGADVKGELAVLNSNNMTIEDIYKTSFLFTQEHNKNYKNMGAEAIKGLHSNTEMSKLFFSDKNIRRLQKKIRNEIFYRTDGEFRLDVDQEQRDLFTVMRATYFEHGRFYPNQVVRQVKRLNQIVVNEIVPGIITEIKQEYGYIREINKPLNPIDRPLNVSNAGRRQLPSFTTTFGV